MPGVAAHGVHVAPGGPAKLAEGPGVRVWNLGTGHGYSVLEMAKAFEQASGHAVPYRFAPRRAGDIAQCWADPARAERELGWKAQRGLDERCEDAWRWQSMNPQGFAEIDSKEAT